MDLVRKQMQLKLQMPSGSVRQNGFALAAMYIKNRDCPSPKSEIN